jgi:hypothetical protein
MSYPKEYFIELTDNKTLLGRILVTKTQKKFMIELDLVLTESRKIYKHLETFFSMDDEDEVLSLAVSKLRDYFGKVSVKEESEK